jgi:16S rRNA (guanine527-N7)-methyltransferase
VENYTASPVPHTGTGGLDSGQREQLERGAEALGITLSSEQLDQFAAFKILIEEAGRTMNLTRIKAQEIVPLQYLDSLLLLATVRPVPGSKLLDVGTGAGFPGLPLAIALPSLHCTLIDATRKKADFARAAAATLGLPNVTVIWARAEDLSRLPQHRHRYDIATARAVARLDVLAGWLLPFVRPGGCAIALKSRHMDTELDAARASIAAAGGRIESTIEPTIPCTDIVRKLVILRHRTPSPHPQR